MLPYYQVMGLAGRAGVEECGSSRAKDAKTAWRHLISLQRDGFFRVRIIGPNGKDMTESELAAAVKAEEEASNAQGT